MKSFCQVCVMCATRMRGMRESREGARAGSSARGGAEGDLPVHQTGRWHDEMGDPRRKVRDFQRGSPTSTKVVPQYESLMTVVLSWP